MCFSSFVEDSHLLSGCYWVAITFLLPNLLLAPEATEHCEKHRSLASFVQEHNALMQLKWNMALFHLPAKPCVCIEVCIYSRHLCWLTKWWLLPGLSNQPPLYFKPPPLIWCFHKFCLKKNAAFFQWVTPMPTQLGARAGSWQLHKCQHNLGMRWWSPWALNFTKTEKRKRNHLPASACAASTK